METDPISETVFSCHLEFRTMDEVHKSNDSEWYAPTSKSCRLYIIFYVLAKKELLATDPEARVPFSALPDFLKKKK
jgi:hypothetical protein